MITNMGYDGALHSIKSRVFVCTIHGDEPLKCSIGDNLEANMHEIGKNMICSDLVRKKHLG